MSVGLIADYRDTAFPLNLLINRAGVGGITGKNPTVSLRFGDMYLDWNDSIFKHTGWAIKNAPLSDRGGGYYVRIVNMVTIGAGVGDLLVAEFAVDDGADVRGVGQDIIAVLSLNDVDFLRKMSTNRMEQASGTPGTLTLYDDDNTTPYTTWAVRDEFGGGIQPMTGVPARRGQAT